MFYFFRDRAIWMGSCSCFGDLEVDNSDALLQRRTSLTLSSLANSFTIPSTHDPASAIPNITAIPSIHLDTNQHILTMFQTHEELWKSPQLCQLVSDYLNTTQSTLQLLSDLHHRLHSAHNAYADLDRTLQRLQQSNSDDQDYRIALEDLRRFEDPMQAEALNIFRSIGEQQRSLLNRMLKWKTQATNELKKLKLWRRISTAIFVSVFAAMIVCSVVVAAMTVPPAVTALVGAALTLIQPASEWVYGKWERYIENLQGELKKIDEITMHVQMESRYAENAEKVGDLLGIQIEKFMMELETGLRDNETMKVEVGRMRKTVRKIMDMREELEEKVEECRNVAKKILERFVDGPV